MTAFTWTLRSIDAAVLVRAYWQIAPRCDTWAMHTVGAIRRELDARPYVPADILSRPPARRR